MEMFVEDGYTLPKKLSDLLRTALGALERFEKDPRYVISMIDWHEPRGGKCRVCLAGVMMAAAFQLDPGMYYTPHRFPYEIRRRLTALSYVGCEGMVDDITDDESMDEAIESEFHKDYVTYNDDPVAFKAWLQKASLLLESHGY